MEVLEGIGREPQGALTHELFHGDLTHPLLLLPLGPGRMEQQINQFQNVQESSRLACAHRNPVIYTSPVKQTYFLTGRSL